MLYSVTGCSNNTVVQGTQSMVLREYQKKDGVLFTTGYDVSDYVEDAIIVSKNDDLLYGLLNNKGKEIIPLKYDDIKFINKDDYLEGKCDDIFLLARCEDKRMVFNISGEVLKESEREIKAIDYKTSFEPYETMPFFCEVTENEYVFYDKKFNVLSKIPKQFEHDENYFSLTFISDKCFICSDENGTGVLLYDFSGNLLHHFEGCYMPSVTVDRKNNNCVLLFSYFEYEQKSFQVSIDANGTISENKDRDVTSEMPAKTQGNSDAYKLYKSNGTWKLEDLSGNTLYDARYYNAFSIDGENDCYCLVNEDKKVMIINRNGQKCIDYGVLETIDNKEDITILTDNSLKKITKIFEGKYGIILPVSSDDGYDIYYFDAKNR